MKKTTRLLLLTLPPLLGASLAPATAEAQALRPNIMILLDTSGSMLYSERLDGSPLCNVASTGPNRTAAQNTTDGQTSRVYNMKNAIRDALAEAGTDEANFGLMRFPQLENATSTGCPGAHWRNGTTNNCTTSTTCTGVTQADNSVSIGCKLTTQNFTTPETAYGTWFDDGVAQSVMVPVTKAATGLKALAAGDYDPTGANITSVYKWIDQSDSGSTGANNPDPELRIPPNTNTPLGRSMFYGRLYFENYVYPNDPRKACRQNILIIATDGAETCDGDKANNATLDLTTCAQTGYDTFHPEIQACLAHHSTVIPKGVLVYILTDSGLSTGDKATANAMAAAGGTGQAIFVTLTDTNAVKQALVDIIAKTVPPAELCNGVDDNCDGQIDEGVSNACRQCTAGNGLAACGSFVISPNSTSDPDNAKGTSAHHCAIEACNCLDDNCNGQIDEGLPLNACGKPCGCAVPTEICDGLDNNCNGDIDEGFNVGASCTNNGVGACRRGGILACKPDGSGTVCDTPTVTPQPEVCNGIDDDCNGKVDDGMLPGVGEKCGNGLGSCSSGTYICQNGKLVCNATTSTPMPETCNGLDDNCDGIIDNGDFTTMTTMTCLCPGLTQAEVDVPNSACKKGHWVCRGKNGFVCEGCVLPTIEVCDGKDNDCDGVIDTAAKCPSGFGCKDGQCSLQCTGGEFPCPSGYKCVNDFCIPQRCAGVTCPSGQKCDEATGSCVDLCNGVSCNSPKTCVEGRCIDCNDPALACTGDKLCLAGVCKTDPCKGVTCQAGFYCNAGACTDLCVPGKCPATQRCVAGQCLPDNCTNTVCAKGRFCNQLTGACDIDPCLSTQCGAGMACISQNNSCEPDPCRTIQCPSDCWTCGVTSDGKGTCLLNDSCKPVENKVGQRGGGVAGCNCETAGGQSPTALGLLALLGLVVAARRRRGR